MLEQQPVAMLLLPLRRVQRQPSWLRFSIAGSSYEALAADFRVVLQERPITKRTWRLTDSSLCTDVRVVL